MLSKISTKLNEVRTWGSGCTCHEHLLVAGEHIDCSKKGRRLKEVRGKVQDIIAEFKHLAESFDINRDCGGVEQLLQDWGGSVYE